MEKAQKAQEEDRKAKNETGRQIARLQSDIFSWRRSSDENVKNKES